MPRMTKAFSYDSMDDKWFKMVDREAAKRRPKPTKSAMMVEIIRDYFSRKKIIDGVNKDKMATVAYPGNKNGKQ